MLEFEELIRWRVIPQVVDEAVALPEGDDETVDGTWTPEQNDNDDNINNDNNNKNNDNDDFGPE